MRNISEVGKLTTGNFVKVGNEIIRISKVVEDNVIVERNGIESIVFAEKISLTKDWLIKFGFMEDLDNGIAHQFYLGGYVTMFSKIGNEYTINFVNHDYKMKYVHELQNLLPDKILNI